MKFTRFLLAFTMIICSLFIVAFGVDNMQYVDAADDNDDIIIQEQIIQNDPVPTSSAEEAADLAIKMVTTYVEEAPIQEEFTTQEYTVQSGDSPWSIAEKYYGNGLFYPYLLKMNNLKESDTIVSGQILKIEPIEDRDATLKECEEYINSTPVVSIVSPNSMKNGKYSDNKTFLGTFFITGYDPYCAHCCGGSTSGMTASGNQATIADTVATSKNIPFGTKLYIEGYGIYTVEDRGVPRSDIIDIACSSHEACSTVTKHNVNVYIVND